MTSEAEQIREMLRTADAEKRKADEAIRQGCRGMIKLWKSLLAKPSAENIGIAIEASNYACTEFEKAKDVYQLHTLTVRQLNDLAAALKGKANP